MAGLAVELPGQVAELRGVVDVVLEHVAQHCQSLLAAVALLPVGAGMAVGLGVAVLVGVGVLVGMAGVLVVLMVLHGGYLPYKLT